MDRYLADAARTRALGAALAAVCRGGGVLYLAGDLGTGKTTLTRGLLQALGHRGAVKSPTYTLLEPYEAGGLHVYHLDLYRLGAPDELEYLGLRDLLEPDALVLVEWPERGEGVLPRPDLSLTLTYAGRGRAVRIEARTGRGSGYLERLERAAPGTAQVPGNS